MAAENLLIRIPNWIGDVVMALPAVHAACSAYAGSRVTLLVQPGLEPLARCIPGPDGVLALPGRKARVREKLDWISSVRALGFTTGLVFPNSFRSALWMFLAGVRRRVGFSSQGRGFLLTDRLVPPAPGDTPRHQSLDYLRIVSRWTGKNFSLSAVPALPGLLLPEADTAAAREKIAALGFPPECALVGLSPTAAYGPAKCWGADRFVQMMRLVAARSRMRFLLFSGPGEKDLTAQIASDFGPAALDLGGRTGLVELLCLMRLCRVFVSNDSGPMHLASALGLPLVSVFGSTDPRLTGPLGAERGVVWKHVSCSPCFKRVCPRVDEPMACMHAVDPAEVSSLVLGLLGTAGKGA